MERFLTQKQRQELLNELKREGKAKYSDRIKVILLLDEGKRYKDIADFLFLDEGTISNYRRRYKDGGIEELISDIYSGKKSYLDDKDLLKLQTHLLDKIYTKTGDICEYILKRFNVKFTISGVTKLLHRLNFAYKKAKGFPGKAKKQDQEQFINKLQKIANGRNTVYFGDATHPTHQTELSYGWILKGTEQEVFTSSGRKRINIMGAVSVETQNVFADFYETINQESVCDFLCGLRDTEKSNKTIYLILDRGPANMALTVRDVAQMLNIEIIYLPAYSPNLNPIERLWKYFKKEALRNKYFEKFEDFKKACLKFFKEVHHHKDDIQTIINYNFKIFGT